MVGCQSGREAAQVVRIARVADAEIHGDAARSAQHHGDAPDDDKLDAAVVQHLEQAFKLDHDALAR